ncbi:Aminoacyl-tRNA synthetase class II [Penicillium hispanicum]|uniref:Aminoacyl-tRNA synthetase class II n=1 Tax=Penicillium hispanicum TaxID=1080232 RepID=UPI00254187D7|nr:Aminoacyl-tRNA synthetase class II [Penicillium hispanicum]KAJ5594787.1 Aminoacyl-tRNA synthetase class II [Penicillium hispanicum]
MAPSPAPYVCFSCRWSPRNVLKQQLLRRSFSASQRNQQILRPATAPKPTPDVKHIRQNVDRYAQNCRERNFARHAEYPSDIQRLSEEARQLDHDLKTPRARIKQLERTIAKLSIAARQDVNKDEGGSGNDKDASEQLAELKAEAQKLKDDSHAIALRQSTCTDEIHRLALSLPNLSSSETPVGNDHRLVNYINFDPQAPPSWTSQAPAQLQARSHVTIGTELGLIDFTSSATTTGWGWYFLINEGAMLEQALVQYALSVARRRGWKPVAPPSIVYSYVAEACGFQPRDQHNEQQIWSIEQNERDRDSKPPRSLTATAEIPLAAMYAGRDIDAKELPIKMVGASRCYRAEAGARGVDTKGLYRVHEFTKVELFGWADAAVPDRTTSDDLFAELLDMQTEILTSLHLPCRVLEMPSTDLGASASRKRDIEALFPSRFRPASTESHSAAVDPAAQQLESAWGEVTSASICTDYQSRRLATRVRGGATKESRFPHTVNGTAMAVPRVLAAILENGWDAERRVVVVPEVLRPWMDGMETIGRQC